MWSCFSYELPNLQLIDNICHTTEQRFIFLVRVLYTVIAKVNA